MKPEQALQPVVLEKGAEEKALPRFLDSKPGDGVG